MSELFGENKEERSFWDWYNLYGGGVSLRIDFEPIAEQSLAKIRKKMVRYFSSIMPVFKLPHSVL